LDVSIEVLLNRLFSINSRALSKKILGLAGVGSFSLHFTLFRHTLEAMEYLPLLIGGWFLGCLHALDADHVCTVTSLILERRPVRKTLALACRWSLGHSATLLALAGMMAAMRSRWTGWDPALAEHLVGLSMIALGCWIFWREWRRMRMPEFVPPDSARPGWVLFGMGVLHGTAGSSAIFLLIPVAFTRSAGLVLAYVALFSAGMVATMALYALAVHRVTWLDALAGHLVKVRFASALLAMGVGVRLLY
jgi:hypothetical protein